MNYLPVFPYMPIKSRTMLKPEKAKRMLPRVHRCRQSTIAMIGSYFSLTPRYIALSFPINLSKNMKQHYTFIELKQLLDFISQTYKLLLSYYVATIKSELS